MADTHGFLDRAIFRYFAECGEVWHAGDFGPFEILEELESFKPLRGVWGNIDGEECGRLCRRTCSGSARGCGFT